MSNSILFRHSLSNRVRSAGIRHFHTSYTRRSDPGPSRRQEFKVVLDNDTLYVPQEVAEALGWKPQEVAKPVQLTLSGWAPNYFAVARTGSDSGAS